MSVGRRRRGGGSNEQRVRAGALEDTLRNVRKVWEDGAVGARGRAAFRVHVHGNRFVPSF